MVWHMVMICINRTSLVLLPVPLCSLSLSVSVVFDLVDNVQYRLYVIRATMHFNSRTNYTSGWSLAAISDSFRSMIIVVENTDEEEVSPFDKIIIITG